MSLKIDQDHSRFRDIVRGKIRQNLRKYISQASSSGERERTSSPSPSRRSTSRASRSATGSAAARGRARAIPAIPIGGDQDGDEPGQGHQAGTGAGEHVLEVDVTLDELAAILGEELELPDIQDKGKSKIINAKDRYTGIRRVGPESLRHFRRTYREALKRQISRGTYVAGNPIVVPIPTTSATGAGRPRPSRSPTPSSST